MDSQIIDSVTEWDAVSVDGGYEGLHRLADGDFTGAVSTGMTWAFVLNGRVIGVFEGSIEDFEDADLTAYRAPDASLPLLFTMMETGGETRAKYYTNETPLKDADSTLSAGGFTGYIELSENVLSGDYYVVYHGGKSMSAAFVGSSRRLVTGDEAFEKANDEVGIYEVKEADIDVVELPEIEGDAAADEPESDDDATLAPDASVADAADEESPDEPTAADADAAEDGPAEADETPEESPNAADPASTTETADATDAPDAAEADATPDAATTDAAGARTTPSSGSESGEVVSSADDDGEQKRRAAERAQRRRSSSNAADEDEGDASGSDKDPFSAEEKWREARSIPSLDPSESSTQNGSEAATKSRSRSKGGGQQAAQKRRRQNKQSVSRSRSSSSAAASKRERSSESVSKSSTAESGGESADGGPAEALKQKLEAVRKRREVLEAERDDLKEERDEQRERAEKLQARVEELEAEVERLTERLEAQSGGFVAEESMPPKQALSGTNLFVRYDRKGEATLERAHKGEVTREEVNDNLRLEHHTTFDTEGLGVEGEPYAEFLHDSTEYGFAKWVVTDLLYEIGETGNRNSLRELFDAIPKIDRVELHGTVGVETEEGVEERDFDVIFRDQMGDALFVADMNTSRNATTQAMVGSLIKNARTVAEGDDGFSTAFYVTESFFDPEALEAVSEETGGGFLSRSKRKSFVKLSRKQGFHLCLVEARNNEFHVNVPDL
ncbi:DUF7527 domain-containing protein [Halopelagius longus]|uniref:DUF7527 domain-containing protein n=1 Tax=Halopelagius longus TaxID=1236180 RepID=A0A1H1BML7_9EURY|nr:hypothetical protein [Halopelagius longus]RDI70845.1 hypothetical protein DWB78_03390 [Halopelagius longus]SDQ53187.1 hypothetical protein SAMN05216278_1865 [Halopelagius longus]